MTRPIASFTGILFLAGCNSGGGVLTSSGGASVVQTVGTGGFASTGGATGSGGASSGGDSATTTASGGAPGGAMGSASGGAGGSGGSGGATGLPDAASDSRLVGSGGSRTGGAPGSGGVTANGGAASTGGRTGAGGTPASGGVTSAGGATSTGGAKTGTGGTTATGGAVGSGGAAGGSTGAGGAGTTVAGITCTPQTWDAAPIGWATVSGSTTGGGNTAPTTVTTLSQLNSAASGSNAAVIHVSGKLSGIVTVGSNKTILGLCGAEIDGSVDMTGSSNVIVRNLKIVGYNCTDSPSDCSGGHDAVHVQGGDHHLWFDHLDISDGSDGNLDITHASDFITVSWTKFHYTGRTDPANAYGHMFSNLIGHSDTNGSEDTGHLNVTFHHCWWADHVQERMPRVRFGKVHVFNSLYTCSGDQTAIAAGVDCNIRDENNVFVGVGNPIDTGNSNAASVVQSTGNVYTSCTGSTANMGGAAFTPTYAYALDSTSGLQATIQAGAGPK